MIQRASAALPGPVRDLITARSGPITATSSAGEAYGCTVAAKVTTASGQALFIKAIHTSDERADQLATEAAVNPHVRHLTPALHWHDHASGWDVLAFTFIPGRPYASFQPGSPDLPAVLAVLQALDDTPAPEPVTDTAATWWHPYLPPGRHTDALTGNALIHADLNPGNFLITPTRAYLLDWGMCLRAAPWLNAAQWVIQLIEAGHPPAAAEALAADIASWRQAPPAHITAFADLHAHIWTGLVSGEHPQPDIPPDIVNFRAHHARQWVNHRRTREAPASHRRPA